jgi:ABC-type sugar transport system substrate-binding protein
MNKRYVLLAPLASLAVLPISPIAGFRGNQAAAAAQPPAFAAPAKAPSNSLKGKRLCIASPVTIDQLTLFYADMQKAAKQSGNGLEITVADAKGDFEKQLAQVEEYVASGNCNAVFYLTVVTKESAEAWGNVAQKAKDAKICMVNHSADWVDNVTMNMSNPHYPAGSMIGEAAAAWYKKNGGHGSVGLLENPTSPGLMDRVKGFQDTFQKVFGGDVKFYKAEVNNTAESGAQQGANLLQAHPDITVMFSWGGDATTGGLQAAAEAGKTDANAFFFGSVDATADQVSMMDKHSGVLQALAWFPFRISAVVAERGIERCLLGQQIPSTTYVQPLLLTPDNGKKIWDALDDQLAPAQAHYFDELQVFFDKPIKTNDPFPDAKDGFVWDGARLTP